jgi:hypothetical protein
VKDGAAILHELFAVKDALYWHVSEAGVSQLLKADANSGNISAIVLPLRGQVSEMSLEPASGQLSLFCSLPVLHQSDIVLVKTDSLFQSCPQVRQRSQPPVF